MLSNISTVNRISTLDYKGVIYTYLGEANIPDNVDFQASTFALATQCKPVGRACGLNGAFGASTPFKCSSAFHGDVTAGTAVGLILLEDDKFTKNITYGSKDLNPYYFGTWARVDTTGHVVGKASVPVTLQSDPEIAIPVHGGLAWVLSCSTTVYEATYTRINGSVQAVSMKPANASLGGIIAAPTNELFGQPDFEIAARRSSYNNNSQDLANDWAEQYSQIALGLSTGAMSPRLNTYQQTRSSILVARIPKIPLFVLIGLNLLYAIIGIVLALYSALFSSPRTTKDVQARLSVAGLVAVCFEPQHRALGPAEQIEDLFTEKGHGDDGDGDGEGGERSARVSIRPAEEGGWRYALL